jgi:hypothetical protein
MTLWYEKEAPKCKSKDCPNEATGSDGLCTECRMRALADEFTSQPPLYAEAVPMVSK